MSILDALQAKVNAVDSSTPMSEILQLMYNVKDHPYKNQYDSAGLMPLDSAFVGSMAYAENRNAMYMLVGVDSGWKLIDSDAATAVSSGGGSHIQGSNFGYSLGGYNPSNSNVIQKYSFTADENATDVADLQASKYQHSSSYSSTDAFTHGGYTSSEIAAVDKFNFSSGANATDFGDFPGTGRYGGGNSSSTHGYQSGGTPAPNAFGSSGQNKILKFPFSAGSLSTSTVGDLSANAQYLDNNASATHGYHSSIAGSGNVIEKFSFSSDGDTTDVGDLLETASDGRSTNGLLSDVSGGFGYTHALDPSPYHISRYSFTTDGNATDYCDFFGPKVWLGSNSSSTTHGYYAGGLSNPGNSYVNTIQKFDYASTSNTTDVGDLLGALGYNAGAAN